jgi:hypothetical protein
MIDIESRITGETFDDILREAVILRMVTQGIARDVCAHFDGHEPKMIVTIEAYQPGSEDEPVRIGGPRQLFRVLLNKNDPLGSNIRPVESFEDYPDE